MKSRSFVVKKSYREHMLGKRWNYKEMIIGI